jgi:hypothetical protein
MADTIFEYEFSLSIANDGYDSLNETIIENIKSILIHKLPNDKLKSLQDDNRLARLKKLYEESLILWGYDDLNGVDMDEVFDVCKKIREYESTVIYKTDLIYIKTVQRSLLMKKRLENMNYIFYEKYKKYSKYFEYIMSWIKNL